MLRMVIVGLVMLLGACTARAPQTPEPTNPQDAAVWYYLSDERHEQFDDLLDHLEQTTGKAMQEQRIPSTTSLRMANWAELETLPRKNMPQASFGAPATDKRRVIALEDSQEFSVVACDEMYKFTTAGVPLTFSDGPRIVTLGPTSYHHYQTTLDGLELQLAPSIFGPAPKPPKGMYVKYRSGGKPSMFEPLQVDRPDIYEIQDEEGRVLTKAEIRTRDDEFVRTVRSINMNSSDCAAGHQLG